MLLGPNGRPIDQFKKAPPPQLGPSFGLWSGRDVVYNQMPGGAILSFNLNNLTLADYRAMRDHPQINASLAVLSFMMHQLDWWIECDNQKIADAIEEMMADVWTRMIRALSQSFWAGYSPIAIEYENDLDGGRVVISKFKDLLPEECSVNWKKVPGYAPPGELPPTFHIYDGIKQFGTRHPIPVENSLWYPLLMENGDFYGRKLLKPAFAPWYYSQLIHLFANRYYERFGEPLPIGRAPFDSEFEQADGTVQSAKDAMETIISNLRNRAVVVLPNDRTAVGAGNSSSVASYDYDIQYLESQMRGADFERYLDRLDEEMSLGIFTPILLFKTGNVGSNNLGVQHTQTFLWMLNALAGDMKEYIDKYVVTRLRDYNFGPRAPRAEWQFRKMGKETVETVRAVLTELVRSGKAAPDLDELGLMAGMSLTEIRQVTEDPPPVSPVAEPEPGGNPDPPQPDGRGPRNRPKARPRGVGQPRATGRLISNRIHNQVEKAWRERSFGKTFTPSLGFRRRFEESLKAEGVKEDAQAITDALYNRIEAWMADAIGLGMKEYESPQDFLAMFDRLLETEIDSLLDG